MTGPRRDGEIVRGDGVEIESYVDGAGPVFVILPSYGRDGGDDFDDISARLVAAGWKVVRPQPRGVAGSKGPMKGLTLHDLANDVATCIRALSDGPVVMLGHAFGNVLARVVTTDHPELVTAGVGAAAAAAKVAPDIGQLPFVAGDPSKSTADRLASLRKGFFAPNHDASRWLDGWYPDTLATERDATKVTGTKESWACGDVPLLQLIAEYDPFIPKPYWNEMRDQFGDRVTATVIKDASHALFPEQPEAVAEAVLPWAAQFQRAPSGA